MAERDIESANARGSISVLSKSARRREAIVSSWTAANDNDPFVGELEKLAGTEKREPYGEPFGNRSHIQQQCKNTSPRD